MKKSASARKLAGFLPEHAAAFKEVAQQNNCIIMCRAPGIFTPGLVAEGYASKGFHTKAKSCNWGPMAGFVLLEPRFSKIGLTKEGLKKQQDYVQNALMNGADPIPLFISDNRLNWLETSKFLKRYNPDRQPLGKKGNRTIRFQPTLLGCKGDYIELAQNYIFTLRERVITNETFWAVYFQENDRKEVKPVKALRDPNWKETPLVQNNTGLNVIDRGGGQVPQHKKATTGDYDLFAVWSPPQINRNELLRQVSSKDLNSNSDLGLKCDPELGNISPYVENICNQLNIAIRRVRWGNARYGYRGGNMVHHGDEAGRPFVDDVDLPFIAFFPPKQCDIPGAEGNTTVAFESVKEFRTLVDAAIKWKYQVELNPGWIKELSEGKNELRQRYKQYVIQGKTYQGIL